MFFMHSVSHKACLECSLLNARPVAAFIDAGFFCLLVCINKVPLKLSDGSEIVSQYKFCFDLIFITYNSAAMQYNIIVDTDKDQCVTRNVHQD